MQAFDIVSVDLKAIKAKKKQTVYFPYNPDLVIKVISIQASCDCTTGVDSPDLHRIVVYYSPGAVPPQLIHQGFYNIEKNIIVRYQLPDGVEGMQVLNIRAKVY